MLGAFTSANYGPLATGGIDFNIHWHRVRASPPQSSRLRLRTTFDSQVLIIRLFPGLQRAQAWARRRDPVRAPHRTHTLAHSLQRRCCASCCKPQCAVSSCRRLGRATAPTATQNSSPRSRKCVRSSGRRERWGLCPSSCSPVPAVESPSRRRAQACDRGVVIVNVTQCLRGGVQSHYATGTALIRAGVVAGGDMTTEAALTKLQFLLGRNLPCSVIRRLMQTDLRGEITVRASCSADSLCRAATMTLSPQRLPRRCRRATTRPASRCGIAASSGRCIARCRQT